MDKAEVQKTLEEIHEIKGTHTFYDIHVHPFEMMFTACQCQNFTEYNGLYRSGTAEYRAPEITDINLQRQLRSPETLPDTKLRAMTSLLNARRLYSHTGSRVFCDHMALSGIDRVLLLPVMAENETGDTQLEAMSRMFGQEEKFLHGYCVPQDTPDNQIEQEMRRVVAKYEVKALKIHPSVTGINLGRQEGIDRVECLLAAAQNNCLKVVIHGGRSPDCKNREATSYGTIENLKKIDWSISRGPVIIAHGACFGHTLEETTNTVIPGLNRLFEQYPNLWFDTSGIGFDQLLPLVERFDPMRILFGSDALYIKQWNAMVKLWLALKRTVSHPQESFLQVISGNPGNLFN